MGNRISQTVEFRNSTSVATHETFGFKESRHSQEQDDLNRREVQVKDSTSECRNAVLRWDLEADACGVSPSPLAAPDLQVRSMDQNSQRIAEGVFPNIGLW